MAWSKEELVVHQRILGIPVLLLLLGMFFFSHLLSIIAALVFVYLDVYIYWPEKMSNFFGFKKNRK